MRYTNPRNKYSTGTFDAYISTYGGNGCEALRFCFVYRLMRYMLLKERY